MTQLQMDIADALDEMPDRSGIEFADTIYVERDGETYVVEGERMSFMQAYERVVASL